MSSGLALEQVRKYIVRPALAAIGAGNDAEVQLVMATGMAESAFKYIDQVTRHDLPGPAYGLWQMERATHEDLWRNFIERKPVLAKALRSIMILGHDGCGQMHYNHLYAAAMCRVHYLRAPAALPKFGDAAGMAMYWKRFYNTPKGAGTVEGFKQKTAAVFSLT